jgi:hypothetical protein
MKCEPNNPRQLMERLLSTIQVLAQSAEKQIVYLQELGSGDCADELALELEDIIGVLPKLQETGFITAEQANLIRALDEQLNRMSQEGNIDTWTANGLLSSEEWEEVRKRANAVLVSLK